MDGARAEGVGDGRKLSSLGEGNTRVFRVLLTGGGRTRGVAKVREGGRVRREGV